MSFSTKSNKSINNDLSSLKDEFYSSRRKHIFSTSSQKKEYADFVLTKMSLDELLQNTIYIIPNYNTGIYIDYSLFKQYASTSNYEYIINHIFNCICYVIEQHGHYELHINLGGFSVSAAERYKECIQLFYKRYFQDETDYGSYMKKMYIYFVPSMMNTISTILMKYMTDSMAKRTPIKEKIIMYSKEESNLKLDNLLNNEEI